MVIVKKAPLLVGLVLISVVGCRKEATVVTPAAGMPVEADVPLPSFGTRSGGAPPPGGTGGTPVALLKADVQTASVYKADKVRVEVLGACVAVEEGVKCWDLLGKENEVLTKKVTGFLVAPPSTRSFRPFVPLRVGSKNRLILVRRSTVAGPLDSEVQIRDTVVGGAPVGRRQISATAVPNDADPTDFPGGEVLLAVNAPKGSAKAFQRFDVPEAIRASAELSCQIGARATFQDCEFELAKIPPPSTFGWHIEINVIGLKSEKPFFIRMTPMDEEGRTFEYVNEEGKPFTLSQYTEAMRAFDERTSESDNPSNQPKFFKVTKASLQSLMPGSKLTLRTNIDPKYIKKISFMGQKNKLVEIGPIPLDPKSATK